MAIARSVSAIRAAAVDVAPIFWVGEDVCVGVREAVAVLEGVILRVVVGVRLGVTVEVDVGVRVNVLVGDAV
jgi:hypothetical protein